MAGSVVERADQIVAVARELLESGGPDAVTMRAIADRLGIRAPSLYKHLPDKRAVEVALIAAGFEEQAAAFETVTQGAPDPLGAIGRVYRTWATAHPHLYRLMTDGELPRDALPQGLELRAAAPLVRAVGGDGTRARAAWAFAHGMASLEIAHRFPPGADLEAAWSAGIDAFRRASDSPGSAKIDA
jgi:AcrR family transcriptional regulator